MPEPLPADPLVCPRCGGPKVWDDLLCPGCAAVAGEVAFDDLIARPGDCIDDPPARDYPQAFGDNEGAD